ncbi:co-chaperone YbbN [Psychromonas sp. psych-6C06]|uniref:tetratricopeptide repeat protein n=1 Tax=Psychromonas sp. psych-6C06 TaxID=2058089 RepID=UPI000C330880|nr:tetratricopeptide repeat protein [Psychromonas sp. psych-6C06]PKF61015.1 co-chaperone YbbN [Psychromonas sp. psych-6C06]
MTVNNHDVNVSTFPQVILEGSKEKPVLVIFWSQQCPICCELLPLIDKIHAEDDQAFVVARINCDVEQQIVNHFGVQSVPSVFMFIDGKGADGFAGEQTEQFIREFIAKHTPDQALTLLQQGQTLFAQGDVEEAKTIILQALQSCNNDNENIHDIKLALAQIYLALGEFESAEPLLQAIPMASQNMIYHSLMSQLELAKQSSQTPEITALEEKLDSAQDKAPIQYQLAVQYNQVNRNSEALTLLYHILLTDLNYAEGDVKKTFLDILATTDDPKLVSEFRRKLYSLLY